MRRQGAQTSKILWTGRCTMLIAGLSGLQNALQANVGKSRGMLWVGSNGRECSGLGGRECSGLGKRECSGFSGRKGGNIIQGRSSPAAVHCLVKRLLSSKTWKQDNIFLRALLPFAFYAAWKYVVLAISIMKEGCIITQRPMFIAQGTPLTCQLGAELYKALAVETFILPNCTFQNIYNVYFLNWILRKMFAVINVQSTSDLSVRGRTILGLGRGDIYPVALS